MKVDFFINEILEDDEIKHRLLTEKQYTLPAQEIADEIKQGKLPPIEPGILPVFVCAYLAPFALKKNSERGIPREITVNTLKDINIWIENCRISDKIQGLKGLGWLKLHYTGELFRIGRLQFVLATSTDITQTAQTVIDTHIPQGEPLKKEDCLASFAAAETFFAAYFPKEKPQCFTCCSWLLNPNLAQILPSNSNIVEFMRLWTPVCTTQDGKSSQAIERVFGNGFTIDNLDDVPQNSTLQRALKKYLLSGGVLDATKGYRSMTGL